MTRWGFVFGLLLSAFSGALGAAPPDTLGYEGSLATAGGQPVTGSLNITFRLYDVQSGGTAVWTEIQPAVSVDGGNFSVDLGSITPLPASIFGRRLYLGIQVQGDSEMLPRPALTAAPYAFRAAGTMRNTIVVPADGTPAENGALLLAKVSSAGATVSNPVAIELDAGTYDLGAAKLDVPSYVTLSGRGQLATTIASTNSESTVALAAFTAARDLTVRNTGTPASASSGSLAVQAGPVGFNAVPAEGIQLDDVTGISVAAPGTTGARNGIWACTKNGRVRNVTGIADGGQFTVAFRADCQAADGADFDGVVAIARNSTDGVRAVYLAGGGTWKNIHATAFGTPTATTTFGVRVFPGSSGQHGYLRDVRVDVVGVPSTTDAGVDGIRIDASAIVDLEGVSIAVSGTKAGIVSGIRVASTPASTYVVSVTDAVITMSGVVDTTFFPGALIGIRGTSGVLRVARAKVDVQCGSGEGQCVGIQRTVDINTTGLQPGTSELDGVTVKVGHLNPVVATSSSRGYVDVGTARITNSSFVVSRTAGGESVTGLQVLDPAGSLVVSNSTIEIQSASPSGTDCIFSGTGPFSLYSSHVRGATCAGGPAPTCAGNTKEGAGFLASTCP